MADLNAIAAAVKAAATELITVAALKPCQILVVGCSTSEIVGQKIGTASSLEVGRAVVAGLLEAAAAAQVYVAAQCCEHLNRALVIEAGAARLYNFPVVTVVPVPKAGGSLAAAAFTAMHRPVVVAEIKAHAGLDIGATLIGMHLQPVVVPVRLQVKHVGDAIVTAARTRPPLIGGERAVYKQQEL
ncbi:MAG: TIGR01440 family protein [Moorella sp. (in: firmicutes)]